MAGFPPGSDSSRGSLSQEATWQDLSQPQEPLALRVRNLKTIKTAVKMSLG